MTGSNDPIRGLRPAGDPPRPSATDRSKARERLQKAIATEQHRRGAVPPVLSWGAVIIAGVLLIFWTFVRPTPAIAVLMETAEAARLASPLEVAEGRYLYTASQTRVLVMRPGVDFKSTAESVAYLLSGLREVWRQPAHRFIQIRSTVEDAIFFDTAISTAYFQLNLDQDDGLGESITEQFVDVRDPLLETGWPIDPDQLQAAMEAAIATSDDTRSTEARLLDLAVDLLRETFPSPGLRGAIFEVLARYDFEIMEDQQSVTVAATYEDPVETRLEVILNRMGQLLSEKVTLLEGDPQLGIPHNTVVFSAEFTLPVIVQELDCSPCP